MRVKKIFFLKHLLQKATVARLGYSLVDKGVVNSSVLCICGPQQQQVGLCHLCNGPVQNGTAVSQLCSASAGLIDGRCCLLRKENNIRDADYVIGLDLSNCSLSRVEDLQDAFNATTVDLSLNPIANLDDSLFEGFIQLANLILPANLVCPGGNASWDKVKVKGETHFCEGQKNICNQTGYLSSDCPDNSFCAPYGPGFFQCSCVDDFHGYKCLREAGRVSYSPGVRASSGLHGPGLHPAMVHPKTQGHISLRL
uniref:All-trans retinoic acid-induced differentiation factor n=1 Tax=Hucho hucho TaxID=62062 RepID=A0A4W5R193_9TELE